MPGVLMVEAMAQLGGVICLQQPVSDGKGLFFFAGERGAPVVLGGNGSRSEGSETPWPGIDGVKFRRPVVPGDTLVMEMELTKFMASFGIAKMTGKAYVDGEVAVEVKEFTFAIQKEKK
jgi:3-hydroxyacyl-[acyl-carrier-protein] dehydratase